MVSNEKHIPGIQKLRNNKISENGKAIEKRGRLLNDKIISGPLAAQQDEERIPSNDLK